MNENRYLSNKVARALLPIIFIIFCALSIIGFKEKLSEFDTSFMLRRFTYKFTMNLRFFVLKDRFYNNTYTKDHKWLSFINVLSLDDYQNVIPFTTEELQRIQNNLDNLNDELNKMGIKFYVIMPPNKNTIYPEYLLPEIPILSEKSRLSQLIEFQRENGSVKIIDVRKRLNELKHSELIYYETDTHWNPRGAYEGYRALIEVIQDEFPTVIPIELDACTITKDQKWMGDLSRMSGWLEAYSTFDEIEPFPNDQSSKRIETIDEIQYTYFENNYSDLPKAIIYRDSFFTAIQPYLAQNFRELIDIWSYQIDMDLIREEKPDIVIFLITERSLQVLL
jgi:hypothetical protein